MSEPHNYGYHQGRVHPEHPEQQHPGYAGHPAQDHQGGDSGCHPYVHPPHQPPVIVNPAYPPPYNPLGPPTNGGAYVSPPVQAPNVVLVQSGTQRLGNCPHCSVGFMQESFSVVGILLAVIFFPLGIICCLMMVDRKCSACGRTA